MTYRWLVLALAFGVAVPVHGDSGGKSWYAGVALGKSRIEDFSTNSMRHDIILGWRPWRYFGLEGSYINLGKHKNIAAPDPILRVDGFGGSVLGFLPIDNHQALFIRYGLHKLDIETGFEGYEPALSRVVGFGSDWALPRQLMARVEVQSIYGITDRHAHGKYQAVSLVAGLFYHFH